MDDLGLRTQTLTQLKRTLYLDGVGANIDRGVWEQLEESHRLTGFQHEFLLRDNGTWVAGLMWKSRDGKNRRKYPMIVCAEAPDTPLLWVLGEAAVRLRATERVCQETESADTVKGEIESAAADLSASRANDLEAGTVIPDWLEARQPYTDLADHSEMGGREGYHRVRYHLERDCGPFLVRGSGGDDATAKHLRVPACYGDPARSFLTWYGILRRLLRPDARLFMVRPIGLSWMDIIVGRPKAPHHTCLLSTLESIPSASAVPFNVDDAFREAADAELTDWDAEAPALYRPALDTATPKKNTKGFVANLLDR